MKSIKTIRKLVEQTLNEFDTGFGGGHPAGGIMDPDMAPFVPHSMGASNPSDEPVEDSKADRADELYRLALAAREATEILVAAIDDPIYDEAYEHAFKATHSLREVLNSLIGSGARPDSEEMVAAPDAKLQKYTYRVGGGDFMPSTYSGGDA